MKYTRPRGTNDFFGERMEDWSVVELALAGYLRNCGYREIRTPIFESTELFVRTVGEATDIVTKEMYTFPDRKGRSLTLRPENTASVMRAYLENGLYRAGGIARYCYAGPMFRYDRPQAGRYRQFHQIGAEALGSKGPAIDAEIIETSLGLYRELGLPQLEVRLNSVGCPACRPAFKTVLAAKLEGLKGELCAACLERTVTNPLRIFDCKECGPVKERLPRITDHLCADCRDHFVKLQGMLGEMGIRYALDPLLVRGLDYYTKTAFEILHPSLGAQNALCGGGRYDGLAEDCGGPPIPPSVSRREWSASWKSFPPGSPPSAASGTRTSSLSFSTSPSMHGRCASPGSFARRGAPCSSISRSGASRNSSKRLPKSSPRSP
jgi:histidyl-tRNA synthetase